MKGKLKKADRTKKGLYDCAIRLFKEKGYENVSIDEIVKEAGTAKGTFYVHFESKAEILIQMLGEYDDYYNEIAQEFQETDSAQIRLEKIMTASGNFTQNVIGLDLVHALHISKMNGIVSSELLTDRSVYHIVYDALELGINSGEFCANEDIDTLANRLLNWVQGISFVWSMKGGSFSLIDEYFQITQVFCKSIRSE